MNEQGSSLVDQFSFNIQFSIFPTGLRLTDRKLLAKILEVCQIELSGTFHLNFKSIALLRDKTFFCYKIEALNYKVTYTVVTFLEVRKTHKDDASKGLCF